MFSIQIYFKLNLLLVFLNLILIFFKKKEYRALTLNIIINILMILSFIEYCLNGELYMDSNVSESLSDTLFLSLIQMFLFGSLILLIYSFFIRDQDFIELDCPSLFKSRLGKIEIGKTMKKSRKKHKKGDIFELRMLIAFIFLRKK